MKKSKKKVRGRGKGGPPPMRPEQEAALAKELRKIEDELRPWVETQAPRLVLPCLLPPKRRLGKPWDAWIAALPKASREDGDRACRIWVAMIDLRNRLQAALKERDDLHDIDSVRAAMVLEVRLFELRSRLRSAEVAYREFAEPFYARHGPPPLAGVMPAAPRAPRERAELPPRPDVPEGAPALPGENESWATWLAKVPGDRRSEALRVQVLFDDMAALRWRLTQAIRARDEERIESLRSSWERADAEYRRLAEPLFAEFGRPERPVEKTL